MLDRLTHELGRFDMTLALLAYVSSAENGAIADSFQRSLDRTRPAHDQKLPPGRLKPEVLRFFQQMSKSGTCGDTARKKINAWLKEFDLLPLIRELHRSESIQSEPESPDS